MATSRTPGVGDRPPLPTPSTTTRSMSRRSSLALSSLAGSTSRPSTTHSTTNSKPSLPSARRISSNVSSSSSSTAIPRTRSSASLASRTSTLTGKSAATSLSTSRARRVLSESQASTNPSSSSNNSNATNAVRRSASASIASMRSPPRTGARRYSRAEAGGLTGFGVVKAGPRVVSPVKMERESNLGGVNDPYSTSFKRPMFAFETTQAREGAGEQPRREGSEQLGRVGSSGSIVIRDDTDSKTSDEDELHLTSPRKGSNPFSSSKLNLSPTKTSHFSPTKTSPTKRPPFSTSPSKRRSTGGGGDENMDIDSTTTIPIRPSSPVRGALSPRSLLGSKTTSNTLRRTKPSRKIDQVDSSSSEDDDIDFLSPRKKAKLPSSSLHSAQTSTSSSSRIARPRTSSGSTTTSNSTLHSKATDRPLLLRSPPPKKPVTSLPSSAPVGAPRFQPSSAPMQRTASRTFPLPSSLPPVPSVPRSFAQSAPTPLMAPPAKPQILASTSAPISRLPRRISNEHISNEHSTMPPPAPSSLARATSPTFTDPSLSLMSIDESQEASFSGSTSNLGDVSTISTTSVRSEETAKRLANLQNMLSRLQMPRKSVGGGGGASSRRNSIDEGNSSIVSTTGSLQGQDQIVPLGGGNRKTSLPIASSSHRRLPSSSRPIGGIVNTSHSVPLAPSSSSSRPSSTNPSSRRISSSFLPSQSFDMSSMSDFSMISDASVMDEPTIKASGGASSVLYGVVAFVDVRTAEGDDSGMIFVDMLKNMGARVSRTFASPSALLARADRDALQVTTRPFSLTTHVIYKSGRPSTLQFVRSCARPPRVVGIAWVVRCAEIGKKADEKAFVVVEDKKEMEKENSLFAIGAGKTAPAQKVRLDFNLSTHCFASTDKAIFQYRTASKIYGTESSGSFEQLDEWSHRIFKPSS